MPIHLRPNELKDLLSQLEPEAKPKSKNPLSQREPEEIKVGDVVEVIYLGVRLNPNKTFKVLRIIGTVAVLANGPKVDFRMGSWFWLSKPIKNENENELPATKYTQMLERKEREHGRVQEDASDNGSGSTRPYDRDTGDEDDGGEGEASRFGPG